MNKVKQVIVLRTAFPDGKGGQRGVRKGKIAAQACHASNSVLIEIIKDARAKNSAPVLTPEEEQWIYGIFTKPVLDAENEEKLLAVYNAAKEAGLKAWLITDSGLTEFNGVPHHTAVSIGPDSVEKIDEITGPNGKFPLKPL